MAARKFALVNERVFSRLFRCSPLSNIRTPVATYSNNPSSKKAEEIDNEPVTFSTSKAAEFNSAEYILNSGRSNKPKFEPYVVRVCLTAFLVYFCVLREESDWDDVVGASLFETVPDMEIIMLRNKFKNSSENDPFTQADKLRLQELEKELALRK